MALAFGLGLLLAGVPGRAQDWTYRIRPGDTVWDLSGKYLRRDIPWQKLQAHNRIADPYRIPPGTLIRLPVAWLKVQPAKATVVGVHAMPTPWMRAASAARSCRAWPSASAPPC